jgi:hypothetical protein
MKNLISLIGTSFILISACLWQILGETDSISSQGVYYAGFSVKSLNPSEKELIARDIIHDDSCSTTQDSYETTASKELQNLSEQHEVQLKKKM